MAGLRQLSRRPYWSAARSIQHTVLDEVRESRAWGCNLPRRALSRGAPRGQARGFFLALHGVCLTRITKVNGTLLLHCTMCAIDLCVRAGTRVP